jgi:hypothetical protein
LQRNDRRVACETYALDSYQNLLFSIIKFRKLQGVWPKSIHLATHNFKRARFLDLHCKALKFDEQDIQYVGIDPPPAVTDPVSVAVAERKNGFEPWKADLYGHCQLLASKRAGRDPWKIQEDEHAWIDHMVGGLERDTDIMSRLLLWRGGQNGNDVFPERLPWE